MEDEKQPTIIIVKKKAGHGGHHGGAWKVAYADFVTAMMAFFMVMWLMNSSSKIKESVAGYFKDPAYYQRCYGAIDALLRGGPLPDNVAYTNLRGIFDALPADQDVFLDSYHFGDRGNDLIARAIAQALLAPTGSLASADRHAP